MRNILQSIIKEALVKIDISDVDFVLEHPADMSHGDYACNVAMVAAKSAGINPRELAEKIVVNIEKGDEIEKIEIAGPGFINFTLTQNYFSNEIKKIIQDGVQYGENKIGKGKTVIVEFSSPNIAKPFTIGHLRSTIIGDSVARIFKASGYKVIRDNHLGDWGTQFGKLIVAIKKWGDTDLIQNSENPVKELVALYVKFHSEAEQDATLEDEARVWFTKLEQGDKDARDLWKMCIDWSLIEFKKIYDRLGVSFDTMLGESFFEDKMTTVLDDLKEKNLLQTSEEAQLVFFPDEKFPPLMILKKDGSTLYATRDLATDKYRKETYQPDLIINEVGIEQSLYFKQIFETEEMLGYFKKEQRVHIAHGLYRFKDGKMSTRKGNAIWLNEVLDLAREKAIETGSLEESADTVAIAGLKFNDLKRDPKGFIDFDWDEILNLKGDSGPYIQYTYARAQSVLRKAAEVNLFPNITFPEHVEDVIITDVERLLYRFPEVVEIALTDYAPHHIAQYLIEISQEFNSFYGNTKLVDTEHELTTYRLAVTRATAIVLQNGLGLLGIDTLENM